MQIQVNGEPREVNESICLPELIAKLNLKPEQVAVELNLQVVRRSEWQTTKLQANDRVEIVHFVGGGCKPGAGVDGSRQTVVGRL